MGLDDAVATPGPDLESDIVALLLPIPNGKVLAAYCALYKIEADVIESAGGSFALLADTSPGAADAAAGPLSLLLRGQLLLAMERRDGQLTIYRWASGSRGESVAPGLALDKAPNAITKLMTGARTIAEVKAEAPDSVYSSRMGRFAAWRQLRRLGKQAKRQARGA